MSHTPLKKAPAFPLLLPPLPPSFHTQSTPLSVCQRQLPTQTDAACLYRFVDGPYPYQRANKPATNSLNPSVLQYNCRPKIVVVVSVTSNEYHNTCNHAIRHLRPEIHGIRLSIIFHPNSCPNLLSRSQRGPSKAIILPHILEHEVANCNCWFAKCWKEYTF